jgi:hypothetical protein
MKEESKRKVRRELNRERPLGEKLIGLVWEGIFYGD